MGVVKFNFIFYTSSSMKRIADYRGVTHSKSHFLPKKDKFAGNPLCKDRDFYRFTYGTFLLAPAKRKWVKK